MATPTAPPGADAPPDPVHGEAARFLRTAAVFVAVGAVLYALAYAWSERVVAAHARTNKFFLVRREPPTTYDYLVLGTSHAAALGYQDMTARLEALTGKTVLNLAVLGGGVQVSRLLYDYALTRHRTAGLLYVVDSFAFYSSRWNEDRLRDTRLYLRAPFDPWLVARLLRHPETRAAGIDFALGFSKINNHDRYGDDVTSEERTRFTRAYRPVKQIDEQRLQYLYPSAEEPGAVQRYLQAFDALLADAQSRGIRVLVIKPPIPERVARQIPGEAAFDARLTALLAARAIPFHDFTHVGNDDALFFDTDHLNRDGVIRFFEQSLAPVLAAGR